MEPISCPETSVRNSHYSKNTVLSHFFFQSLCVIRIFLATTFAVINNLWRIFFADSCLKRPRMLMKWTTTPTVEKSDVHWRKFIVAVVWDSVSVELWLLTGFIVHMPTCQMTDEWIQSCSWIIVAGGRGGSTGSKARSAPLSQQQIPHSSTCEWTRRLRGLSMTRTRKKITKLGDKDSNKSLSGTA